MKPLAFGVAFAGMSVGYGIASLRRDLEDGENATCCVLSIVLILGMVFSHG